MFLLAFLPTRRNFLFAVGADGQFACGTGYCRNTRVTSVRLVAPRRPVHLQAGGHCPVDLRQRVFGDFVRVRGLEAAPRVVASVVL